MAAAVDATAAASTPPTAPLGASVEQWVYRCLKGVHLDGGVTAEWMAQTVTCLDSVLQRIMACGDVEVGTLEDALKQVLPAGLAASCVQQSKKALQRLSQSDRTDTVSRSAG